MDIIYQNPYRVVGVLAAATEREIQRQRSKIEAYSKIGKEIKSDFDFDFADPVIRDEAAVAKALSSLEQSQDKVTYALFWFLNYNSVDDIAINHLKSGNKAKSYYIWQRVTSEKDINENNFSAFNNISTLYLMSDDMKKVELGVELKLRLINSSFFKYFTNKVADQTFIFNKIKQQEVFIDLVLSYLRDHILEDDEILDFFSSCNKDAKRYIIQKLTQKEIYEIETLLEHNATQRKSEPDLAFLYGSALYSESKEQLSYLKSILGADDLNYKMIADRVAQEIMQCADDYFERQDDPHSKELSETILNLLDQAVAVVAGSQLIEKINNNIQQIKQLAAEGPMLAAFEEMDKNLKSIEVSSVSIDEIAAVLTMCKKNLSVIKNSPGVNDEMYFNLSSSVVMRVLNLLIGIVNESQTNLAGNHYKLELFKITIPKAFNVMVSLRLLAMNNETKAWYLKNYTTIKELNEHAGQVGKQNSGSGETSNAGTIIFWVVIVIVVLFLIN